ncbi:MAG: FAD-binding oxidoreductase [Hyphomicrobiales bacterium]|nr:FAD-binding oxidoreductase [Hyphomicrobiales bacterium]
MSNQPRQVSERGWLKGLSAGLKGQIGVPGTETYRSGTRVWNQLARRRKPLAVIKPNDQEDVVRTLRWARSEGVRVSPRSGGHSFDGFPVQENTILLDLSGLNAVRLDRNGWLHAGPGARIESVARALSPAGFAVPTGDCPTVALGGLMTGGGFGYATRLFGMTLDSLKEATIVTADGDVRRVDANTDPDLFWACRGGGSVAGIVTEFVLDTFRTDRVTVIGMGFAWDAARDVIEIYDTIMRSAPRELDLKLKLRSTGIGRFLDTTIAGPADTVPGVPLIHIDGQFLGSKADAEPLLRPLLENGALRHATIAEEGYFDAMIHLVPLPTLAEPAPETLIPQRVASDFLVRDLRSSDTDTIVDFMMEVQDASDLTGGCLLIEPADGVVHEVAPKATAFPHRAARLVFEWEMFHPMTLTPAVNARLDGLLDLARKRMGDAFSGGRYLNYADRLDAPWNWWGGNVDRLDAIARHYDPEALLVSRLRPASASAA